MRRYIARFLRRKPSPYTEFPDSAALQRFLDRYPNNFFGSQAYAEGEARRISGATTLSDIPPHMACLVELCQGFDAKTKVLVVGCGVGLSNRIFSLAGLDVDYTGIDINESLIETARKHFGASGKFLAHDGEDLPFDDQSFDIVVLEGSLQYAIDWRKMLGHACRVCKSRLLMQRVSVVDDHDTLYFSRIIKGTYVGVTEINERELLKFIRDRGYLLSDIVLHKRLFISDSVTVHSKTLCADRLESF